jgi:micrococcal nuclease
VKQFVVGLSLLIAAYLVVVYDGRPVKPVRSIRPSIAHGELQGRVIHITDGDTLSILSGKETIKIRLEGIDAPETRQAFGSKATAALKQLVAAKNVVIHTTGRDQYQRTLGTVFLSGMNVNAKLVADGWAWRYKYSNDQNLARLESIARSGGFGLWADKRPIPPWEFRSEAHRKSTGR